MKISRTNRLSQRFIAAPTPMSGLALGIASLGWCWEYLFSLSGYAQWTGAFIAACLISVLSLKFMTNPAVLREELAHPVVGSVIPTFSMTLMVISHSLGQFYPLAGDVLWLFAVILHLILLIFFFHHRFKKFRLHHMVPSWFIPPIGIVAADISFSGSSFLAPVAQGVLDFGLLAFAVMLPLMAYRLLFADEIPDAAKPTLAIMAAPASLTMSGYLTITENPSPLVVGFLSGLALLMTSGIYLKLIRLLNLPFSPGYAAFTFPLVIGAAALFKVANWMSSSQTAVEYEFYVRSLASIELAVATAVVAYVSLQFVRNFAPVALRSSRYFSYFFR